MIQTTTIQSNTNAHRINRMGTKMSISSDFSVTNSLAETTASTHFSSRLSRIGSRASSITSFGTATKVPTVTTTPEKKAKKLPTVEFSAREIELIRYTWNKMLLEEPICKFTKGIPGAFPTALPNETEIAYQNSLNKQKNFNANTMASSLFCRQLYTNLLQRDPSLESLFPSIRHQAAAMGGVLSLVISQLGQIEVLNDYLAGLAKRHSRILGIERPQYELLGEALVQTFVERFGNKFTHELEELWVKLYVYVASFMMEAGKDPVMDPTCQSSEFSELAYTYSADTLSSNIVHPDANILDKDNQSNNKNNTNTNTSTTTTTTTNNNNNNLMAQSSEFNQKPSSTEPISIDDLRVKKRHRITKKNNCVIM